MIIPDSFNAAYEIEKQKLEHLKELVDGKLRELENTHLGVRAFSRIKTVESLFTKVLVGKYEYPLTEIEDFFACTLVLPNLTYIDKIQEDIGNMFRVIIPSETATRTIKPSEFEYSDLHLYLALKDSPLISNKELLERKFELQIKTFLQSAWSQAGHDIIYLDC